MARRSATDKLTDEYYKSNVRWAFRALGIVAATLETKLKISNVTARRYISGEVVPGTVAHRQAVADCLGITEEHLRLPPADFETQYAHLLQLNVWAKITNHDFEDGEFAQRAVKLANEAKHFVTYIVLSKVTERIHERDPYELCDQAILNKIKRGELKFNRVEVFFTKERLAGAIEMSRTLKNKGYYCRYYLQPPKSYPTINIRSYDNKKFLIGGFCEMKKAHARDWVLEFEGSSHLVRFFSAYAQEVIDRSEPIDMDDWKGARAIVEHLLGLGRIEKEDAIELNKIIPATGHAPPGR